MNTSHYRTNDLVIKPDDWAIDKDDPYNHAAYQVEIMQGIYDLWITFKDIVDVDNNFRGRVYRNSTTSSIDRVFRVISKMHITIKRDGRTPVIIAERGG